MISQIRDIAGVANRLDAIAERDRTRSRHRDRDIELELYRNTQACITSRC